MRNVSINDEVLDKKSRRPVILPGRRAVRNYLSTAVVMLLAAILLLVIPAFTRYGNMAYRSRTMAESALELFCDEVRQGRTITPKMYEDLRTKMGLYISEPEVTIRVAYPVMMSGQQYYETDFITEAADTAGCFALEYGLTYGDIVSVTVKGKSVGLSGLIAREAELSRGIAIVYGR